MVEKLTLSKMQTYLKSAEFEQNENLALRLAEPETDGRSILRSRACYQFNGVNLAARTSLSIRHSGEFQCTVCRKGVKKLFDGFCYPCLQKSAQADRCLLNPVNCHFVAGTCREPDWGLQFCYQPHFLYLAFTDKFKVGITRCTQIPTRWIDQGATMAVLLAKTGSRHQSGLLEAFLSAKFADKSHWMKMLKAGNHRPDVQEFAAARSEALSLLKGGLAGEEGQKLRATSPSGTADAGTVELIENSPVLEIDFPLDFAPPEKISSLNLDKVPELKSKVLGVKGQYLFLENGVFNFRRHEGYVVDFELGPIS